MGIVIYLLCAVTAFSCGTLLLLSYRRTYARLLLWSGLCFVGLSLANLMVIVDLLTGQDLDVYTWRNVVSLFSMGLLLYGLIWDSQS